MYYLAYIQWSDSHMMYMCTLIQYMTFFTVNAELET
jgi:hypothetical protein